MDADRFDVLTRSMATPANRRRALGVLTAGGLFGSFWRGGGPAAAQRTTCSIEFLTTVRQGPGAQQVLTNDSTVPGEARGEMSFSLSPTGALEDGVLRLTDGTTLPVIGQATGNSLNIRIDAGQGIVFVGVGVGQQDIAACQGAIDGIMSGPQAGDLGDWHAVSLGQATATGTGGGQSPAGGAAPRPAGSASRPPSGGSPPPGGQAPGPGGTCPDGQDACAGVCVDLETDLANCGACGAVCESRLVAVQCRSGICERAGDGSGPADCLDDRTDCDGQCVDLNTDSVNCGACGEVCELGTSCQNGECAPIQVECPPEQTICGEVCVDTDIDDLHCGACFNVCPDGTACFDGVCEPACGDLTDCGGLCVDLQTDPLHCGACGADCDGEGFFCADGECNVTGGFGCRAPLEPCGDVCVDTSSDLANCGACGTACAPNAICTNSECVGGGDPPPPAPIACNPGQENCFGVCVDTTNNAQNCGACGVPCPAGQLCQGRVCVAGGPACEGNLVACGGICVDTMTNPFACGACTNVCAEGQTCQGGECVTVG